MIRRFLLTLSCLLAVSSVAFSQNTGVGFNSGDVGTVKDQSNNPLTQGAAGDGNGAVLQLGYFSGATAANPFGNLSFIPLSGEGASTVGVTVSNSSELANQTSIGDTLANSANSNGTFAIDMVFTSLAANLPANGTPLAIRFYNNTTIGTSSFFNTVTNFNSATGSTDSTWQWQNPTTPSPAITLSLFDQHLVWQDNGHPFQTTIATAIPEPSSYLSALLGFALFGAGAVRRRLKS